MGWQRVREHSRDAAALVPELARSALRPPARQAPAPREGPRSARSHWPAGRRRPHAPGLPPLPPRSTLPEAVQFPESQWPRGILVHCLLWLGFLQQRTGREQVRGWGCLLESHLALSKPSSSQHAVLQDEIPAPKPGVHRSSQAGLNLSAVIDTIPQPRKPTCSSWNRSGECQQASWGQHSRVGR